MNLLDVGYLNAVYPPILYRIVKEFDIKNCHIIYVNKKLKAPLFTKFFFYNFGKFYTKGPTLSEISQFKPLDTKLLGNMAYCEAIVLRMMDRIVFYLPEFLQYNYRKIFYLNQVRYWNHMLDENQIDLAIFDNIPHEIFTYIIFHLCKLKNIPTVVLFQTDIDDSVLFFDNFEDPHIKLKITYNQLRIDLKNTPESEIQLSGRFNLYLNKQTEKLHNLIPFYMKNSFKKRNTFLGLLKGFFLHSKTLLFQILYLVFTFHIKRKDLKKLNADLKNLFKKFKYDKANFKKEVKLAHQLFKYYNRLTVAPDFSKKYIYVPLHLQPELSTSPLASFFVDQQLMVQLLSYFLPEDIYLYIKEHPKQGSTCRSKEFYNNLLLNSNVQLISRTIDTFKLIDNSIAVATCTGMAGWEAIFREKPVLLFGNIYYQYMKGVFRIKTIEDCRKALDQIIKQNAKPTLKKIKIFLKAMELTAIEGYSDLYYKEVSNITHKQNIKNLSQAFIEKIRSIFDKYL